MKKVVSKRDPNKHNGFPDWFHHHGLKMRLKQLNEVDHVLVIKGSAATIIIKQVDGAPFTGKEWAVNWEVIQSMPDEIVRGCRRFRNEELAAAFALTDKSGEFGLWIIDRFGADSAEQGKYIRWRDFLNIPCPGTGNDGDPNVSIDIDGKIQDAVLMLLRSVGFNPLRSD